MDRRRFIESAIASSVILTGIIPPNARGSTTRLPPDNSESVTFNRLIVQDGRSATTVMVHAATSDEYARFGLLGLAVPVVDTMYSLEGSGTLFLGDAPYDEEFYCLITVVWPESGPASVTPSSGLTVDLKHHSIDVSSRSAEKVRSLINQTFSDVHTSGRRPRVYTNFLPVHTAAERDLDNSSPLALHRSADKAYTDRFDLTYPEFRDRESDVRTLMRRAGDLIGSYQPSL